MKINKDLLYYGAGAGIGAAIPTILKKYDGQIFDGPWGTYSTLIPMATGGLGIAASLLPYIRNADIKHLLFAYGITAFVTGILNGSLNSLGLGLRMAGNNSGCTPCGGKAQLKGYMNWPYTSKAKGWASDIVTGPRAQIPTTIPGTVIVS